MPVYGSVGYTQEYIAAFRKALYAHFTKRGIPSYRHKDLEWKWLRQKGMRAPILITP